MDTYWRKYSFYPKSRELIEKIPVRYVFSLVVIMILLCHNSLILNAQEHTGILDIRRSAAKLRESFTRLYNLPPSLERDSINNQISNCFHELLTMESSFFYPWDELDMIGKVKSPDQKVKVFTWHLSKENGEYEYFGFIQIFITGKKKEKSILVYKLNQSDEEFKNLENAEVTTGNWPGMLYYDLIPFSHKKNDLYLLLGYSFKDPMSQQKVMEVLTINRKGQPEFGGEFIRGEEETKRVVFRYSEQVVMRILYDDRLKMVVFDHLQPFEPILRGDYRFYAPDGSYDAYEFSKGSFYFREDVDARNESLPTPGGSGR